MKALLHHILNVSIIIFRVMLYWKLLKMARIVNLKFSFPMLIAMAKCTKTISVKVSSVKMFHLGNTNTWIGRLKHSIQLPGEKRFQN